MTSNADVVRLYQSIKGILDQIPLDTPITDERLFIDPSKLNFVPQYLKSNFQIVFRYGQNVPFNAACLIYSPKNVVTVVIIINKRYETLFSTFLQHFPNNRHLADVCSRRSIYIHETCHLIAVINLFPYNYDTATRQVFREKIEAKFGQELNDAEGMNFFAHFEKTVPPYIFSNDHFQYDSDNLNYNELYPEIMINDGQIRETVKKMFSVEMLRKLRTVPIYEWIALLIQIEPEFFVAFSNKRDAFNREINSYLSASRSHP